MTMGMEDALTFLREYSLPVSLLTAAVVGFVSWLVLWGTRKPVIDATKATAFPLVEKKVVNENTRIFTFSIGDGKMLNLPIGKHVAISAPAGALRENITRKYTPISSPNKVGSFDLLIKVYPSPAGLMSRHLDSLEIGQTIDVKGPHGTYVHDKTKYNTIGMLAGGTGITPMWQVIEAVLKDASDNTTLKLISANVTEPDILLRDQLDNFAKTNANQFSRFYVLNNPPENWDGGVGFVSEEHIREHIGTPRPGLRVLLCGPMAMNSAMRKHLTAIGFEKADIFAF